MMARSPLKESPSAAHLLGGEPRVNLDLLSVRLAELQLQVLEGAGEGSPWALHHYGAALDVDRDCGLHVQRKAYGHVSHKHIGWPTQRSYSTKENTVTETETAETNPAHKQAHASNKSDSTHQPSCPHGLANTYIQTPPNTRVRMTEVQVAVTPKQANP